MRRKAAIAAAVLAGLLALPLPAGAQQVVIDPSQIAASATNAAEQVDYMLDQLGELADMGDQLSTVKGFIDDVFGEGGAGGKTISVLQDLGTLDRLATSYNATLRRTEEYAKMMEEMGRYRLSDTNTLLSYIRSMKSHMEMAVETARHILATLGFSKKEKKDEIEEIIAGMERELTQMDRMMEIEMDSTVMAEGLCEFFEFTDSSLEPDGYVESRKGYGSMEDAGRGTLGILSLILALLGAMSGAYATLTLLRGGIMGDPRVENVFFRVGAGLLAGSLVLSLISQVSGLNF